MTIPASLFGLTATHKRPTSVPVDGATFPFTAAQSLSFTTQYPFIQVVGSGLSAGVTISITGTLNGATQTEDIFVSHTGSLVKRGADTWATVTEIRSSSTSDGTVDVQMIFGSGNPAISETILNTNLKGRLQRHRFPRYNVETEGAVLIQHWVFYTNGLTVESGDILEISSDRYLVESVYIPQAKNIDHHAELELKKLT